MRRTKIVCTVGPASDDEAVLKAMIRAGMDVARINFSHVEAVHYDSVRALISRIRNLAEDEGRVVAILQDLQGPRLRVGRIAGGEVPLTDGALIALSTRDVPGDATAVPVEFPSLPRDVRKNNTILIADGAIELRVESTDDTDVFCRVVHGGILKSHKGINLPGVTISLPTITEKDERDAVFGAEVGVDWVALSFVRQSQDVTMLKEFLSRHGASTPVIAKIEKHEGVTNFDGILQVADGIMVARGDLGIEMPAEQVPLLQKMLISRTRAAAKPVITATQMLESMIHSPRPTRAEASDVANAIFDGTDGVMLSGETAAGEYPVQAVETMARIAVTTETALPYAQNVGGIHRVKAHSAADAIAEATCEIAFELEAKAIITSTASGRTARLVARHRPPTPILAVTPLETTRRQLALSWGVQSFCLTEFRSVDEMIGCAVTKVRDDGLVNYGDVVVITAGAMVGTVGATNLLKVHVVGEETDLSFRC